MGLIKTVKNFGKDGCYDLEYYADVEGVERVFVKRNDKDVEFWLSSEDVYLLESYKYRIITNGYISRSSTNLFSIMHMDILDKWVDHINHIKCDNTRMNLRYCTPSNNALNYLTSYYIYSKEKGNFRLRICDATDSRPMNLSKLKANKYPLNRVTFKSEKEVLKVIAGNINDILSGYFCPEFIYNIFQDFSFNSEALFGFYRGEYNYETAIKKLMMTPKIKDNIWYWYRFNLFDCYKSIGVEAPVKGVDWFENDLGFIVDKEGFSFNPRNCKSKYYYKYN